MAKIFITGGMGFIGFHLAQELARQGHEVVIYDAFLNFIPLQKSSYHFYINYRLKELQQQPKVSILRGDVRYLQHLAETLRQQYRWQA